MSQIVGGAESHIPKESGEKETIIVKMNDFPKVTSTFPDSKRLDDLLDAIFDLTSTKSKALNRVLHYCTHYS